MSQEIVAHIDALFSRFGANAYEGGRRESVSALEHALQCAQLAEWTGAPPALVAAALLHDIGHFVDGLIDGDHLDDRHEHRALHLLSSAFGPEVTEPIRLHVAAKRYLVTVEPGYRAGLSSASIHSLALQGGDLDETGRAAFEAEPFAAEAVALRRWDDAAKQSGKTTPSLAYYLALLEELCAGPQSPRTAISAFDLS
jgi:phosphonate degradation associated HDIG domain protein